MNNLIYKEDAIKVINDEITIEGIVTHYEAMRDAVHQAKKIYNKRLEELPPAEPQTRLVAEITLSQEQIQDAINKAVDKLRAEKGESERGKGKWIKEDRGHVEYDAVCSEWGFDWMWSDRGYFKFCPHCGADMRQDSEAEE